MAVERSFLQEVVNATDQAQILIQNLHGCFLDIIPAGNVVYMLIGRSLPSVSIHIWIPKKELKTEGNIIYMIDN